MDFTYEIYYLVGWCSLLILPRQDSRNQDYNADVQVQDCQNSLESEFLRTQISGISKWTSNWQTVSAEMSINVTYQVWPHLSEGSKLVTLMAKWTDSEW